MRKVQFIKLTQVVGAFILVLGGAVLLSRFSQVDSANLTSVSVTLSNPRPSFRGQVDGSNTSVGSSKVTIKTSGTPSTSTVQLQTNDTVMVGGGTSYTVTNIPSSSTFNITPVLGSGDADDGDPVISTQTANLTVKFTTANAVANGRFRILIPAETNDTSSADGLPDSGNFDFSTSTPTVTCPGDISGYDFVSGVATASAVTVDGQDYHTFTCAYSGTGAIGTAFDGSTNDAIGIAGLINPAPKSGHTAGQADTYKVIVQHLDSSDNVQDQTSVSIGVIEAVRVTAEVAPQITFRIAGVSSSTSTCGTSTDVTTTATAVPLGALSIDSFVDAAQTLTVSTNAAHGYAVTAVESDQLNRDRTSACSGDGTSNINCIPDSAGDDSAMTHTNADDWSNTSTKGFAYTIENDDANSVSFEYSGTTDSCDGGNDCYKQFADAQDSQSPVTLFSSSTVADSENVNVCYKAVVSATQPAGNYENYVTYTATATF
jgi:hypothetical protein